MKSVKGTINEALAQVAAYNKAQRPLAEAAMSKPQSIEDYARAVGVNKQEQQWIIDNEDAFNKYHNNSALKKSWLSLSYPIYDGDYYFAFIGDNEKDNAKANAEANRKLRVLARSKMSNEEIYDDMEMLFTSTKFSNLGGGDTMTREELWRAIQHIRRDYKEETQIEGWEELEEKALIGRMKTMARNLLDKMRKRAKKIKLPESLELHEAQATLDFDQGDPRDHSDEWEAKDVYIKSFSPETNKLIVQSSDAKKLANWLVSTYGLEKDDPQVQRLVQKEETDKYGNPKLSDSDKDKIGKLRQKIKDHEILADRLRDEISQIKKNAGVEH